MSTTAARSSRPARKTLWRRSGSASRSVRTPPPPTAAYYYTDQKGGGDSARPMDHQIATFETAVREHPDDASARANLAALYFAEGRYDEAIEQYEVALEGDEENETYLVGLGRALLSAGGHRAAAEKFQK